MHRHYCLVFTLSVNVFVVSLFGPSGKPGVKKGSSKKKILPPT